MPSSRGCSVPAAGLGSREVRVTTASSRRCKRPRWRGAARRASRGSCSPSHDSKEAGAVPPVDRLGLLDALQKEPTQGGVAGRRGRRCPCRNSVSGSAGGWSGWRRSERRSRSGRSYRPRASARPSRRRSTPTLASSPQAGSRDRSPSWRRRARRPDRPRSDLVWFLHRSLPCS